MRLNNIIILLLLLAIVIGKVEAIEYPLNNNSEIINKTLNYFKSIQQNNSGFGDSYSSKYADITPFVLMFLKSVGENITLWEINNQTPIDFLLNYSLPLLNKNDTSPTHYAVNIIALKEYNIDIENITINKTQRNLTQELIDRLNITTGKFNTSSWITDELWGLLALSLTSVNNTQYTRILTEYILNSTNPDGGWGCYGGWCPNSSSPDETALALMALKASGYNNTTIIENAFDILYQYIDEDGGINYGWGSNIYSTSWVLMALNTYNKSINNWYYPLIEVTYNNITTYENTEVTLDIKINLRLNHLPEYLINMQNQDGSFKENFPYKPAQGSAYSILSLIGSGFLNPENKHYKEYLKNKTRVKIEISGGVLLNTPSVFVEGINTIAIKGKTGDYGSIKIIKINITDIERNISKIIYVSLKASKRKTSSTGGGLIIETKTYVFDIEKEKSKKIKIKFNDKIKIKLKREEHTISIDKYNKTHITIIIKSDPKKIVLEFGKEVFIDIDNDGIEDVVLKVVKENSKFVFEIKEIEPIRSIEEEQTIKNETDREIKQDNIEEEIKKDKKENNTKETKTTEQTTEINTTTEIKNNERELFPYLIGGVILLIGIAIIITQLIL